jgi:hypothetical protein
LRDGDTLVFIDFPDFTDKAKTPVDCSGVPFQSQEFRVRSEKLLATGSPKFAEMLQPSYQFRIQRRRKVVNRLPDGIKYVLDLTPPSEGDEMVFQMTELSLTPGIIKWWMSCASQGVDFHLVKGHDDCCVCKEVPSRPDNPGSVSKMTAFGNDDNNDGREITVALPATAKELCEMRRRGQLSVVHTPEYYRIPDYCPIRHRNSIIRLLLLIGGRDILLDSAARIWSLVAIAKIWECIPVIKPIVSLWLLDHKNCRFIEILPEESLKIGFALESHSITQSAFQILVNEMAIEEAGTSGQKPLHDYSHATIFGRVKGDVDDELKNLIQHAARALVDRVSGTLVQLQSPDLFNDWNMPEWGRLTELEQALDGEKNGDAQDALQIVQKLREYMRKIVSSDVMDVLLPSARPRSDLYAPCDKNRATYVEPPNFEVLEQVMAMLNPIQRLLTAFPYAQLEKQWDEALFVDKPVSLYSADSEGIVSLNAKLTFAVHKLGCGGPSSLSPASWATLFEYNGTTAEAGLKHYNIRRLEEQVLTAFTRITSWWFQYGATHPIITRHLLLMLQENELKYLPLWAGGNNDGTGGVFEDHLPSADMGPSGPGPAYHTGATLPSAPSSLAGSFVDDMSDLDLRGSTTAASVDVQDSISTVYRPNHVIADDKSIASETFSTDSAQFQEAKDAVPEVAFGFGASEESIDAFMNESDDGSASTIGASDFDVDDADTDMYEEITASTDPEVVKTDKGAVMA